MTARAFWIVKRTHINRDKYNDYVAGAGPIVQFYGGEVMLVAKDIEDDHTDTIVVRFPSLEASIKCKNDPQYQKLIPIREEALSIEFFHGVES